MGMSPLRISSQTTIPVTNYAGAVTTSDTTQKKGGSRDSSRSTTPTFGSVERNNSHGKGDTRVVWSNEAGSREGSRPSTPTFGSFERQGSKGKGNSRGRKDSRKEERD